jgi:hypothetical protein
MKEGQHQSRTIEIVMEMPIEKMMEFLGQTSELRTLLVKYLVCRNAGNNPDELLACSIAYHLTKLVHDYGPLFKKLEKNKNYWKHINYEACHDVKISGKGKILC